jgi:hypothetical protein
MRKSLKNSLSLFTFRLLLLFIFHTRNFRGAKVRLHLNAAVLQGWLKGDIDIDIDDVVQAELNPGKKKEEEAAAIKDASTNKLSKNKEKNKLRQEWI